LRHFQVLRELLIRGTRFLAENRDGNTGVAGLQPLSRRRNRRNPQYHAVSDPVSSRGDRKRLPGEYGMVWEFSLARLVRTVLTHPERTIPRMRRARAGGVLAKIPPAQRMGYEALRR